MIISRSAMLIGPAAMAAQSACDTMKLILLRSYFLGSAPRLTAYIWFGG